MADFRKISIDNKPSLNTDICVVDRSTNSLVFLSCIGYITNIKEASKALNYNNNVYINGYGTYKTMHKGFNTEIKRTADNDFSHLVAYLKDKEFNDSDGDERIICYLFARNNEDKYNILFDKLYQHLSVPLLKDWMEIIFSKMYENDYITTLNVLHIYDDAPFYAYKINIKRQQLLDIITTLLKTGEISIRDTNLVSETMCNIDGLDTYLNSFGDILAQKIQQNFVPKFIPGEQEYSETVNDYDDSCYEAGLELFDAQKSVIQACVNNFKKSDITFIIGECGSGKTLLGSGITYASKKQLGNTVIVMCPSHLLNKWKREVERLVPNGKGYIVSNLEELKAIESFVLNKNKKENSYIIISKESAKFNYEMCPSAIWSLSKKTFVCPDCGQILYKKSYEGTGRFRREIKTNFKETDMNKEYAYNSTCMNKVKVWNKKKHLYEDKDCNCKLWKPLTKEELIDSDWIKLGKEGWLLKSHVVPLYDKLIIKPDITKKENSLLIKLEEKVQEFESTNTITGLNRAPRKYSLSKYIKKFWKGKVDYFIADEVHLYKSESEQGYAFADFVNVAKKTLCLTGTLLNGYADGLFYLLYRTIPYTMQEDGFEYSNCGDFLRTYGVVRRNNRYDSRNQRIGNTSEKRLPGVSPLVFTKFLLENAVFLSLSDMSEALPEYTEYPYPVDMDNQLVTAYNTFESDIRQHIGGFGRGMKIMGQMVQSLSVYPDMPYNQPPIIHPETNDVLAVPTELEQGLRNKENALLDLIQEKVDNNEKVLVYYQWTNRTDTAKKLKNALIDLNIQTAILESKVSADEREEWVEKQLANGVQVVLCNPTLVETGLDLMDFTTIIFYQIGYNIFTMRQASRRSWRLGQEHPISVYFMYYRNTIQEQALSLMATKLQASMAIEGKFSEEGLRAMSNNEDLLTQIANSVVNGIKDTVDANSFQSIKKDNNLTEGKEHIIKPKRIRKTRAQLEYRRPKLSRYNCYNPKLDNVSNINSTIKNMLSNNISLLDISY